MRCLHPIEVREWSDRSQTHFYKLSNGKTWTISSPSDKYQTNSYRFVPCGKCVACLSRKRNDWSFRLMKEQAASSYSFFLTLTYDDQNIPVRIVDNVPYFVFNKKHVQDYLKRVRYYVGELKKDIVCRYYCVSEYGKKTQRPHYHMQFFVQKDDNLSYYKSICNILESNWTFGYFQRKPTNAANIHYVTKYCIKSLDDIQDNCIDPPFILCSKRPYLGAAAESTLELQDKEQFEQPIVYNNGFRQTMPRIYRNKLGLSGCSVPESEHDPRLTSQGYRDILNEYRKTHAYFDMHEFTEYINRRFVTFERDAIRRQTARNEKL